MTWWRTGSSPAARCCHRGSSGGRGAVARLHRAPGDVGGDRRHLGRRADPGPFAAYLAPAGQRGKYVGRVMSGLLLGFCSPVPGRRGRGGVGLAQHLRGLGGRHAGTLGRLWRILPQRRPDTAVRYGELLRSTVRLAREEPVLRRRSAAQALMFGAFSCFWTSIAYSWSTRITCHQLQIAGFALVGAGGAAAALVAGVLGDRGHGGSAAASCDRRRRRGDAAGAGGRGQRVALAGRQYCSTWPAGQPGAQPARHLRAAGEPRRESIRST